MKLQIKHDCSGVNWQAVRDILKSVGMGHHAPEVHRKAFEASHTTVFVYDAEKLVGFGRAISDGAYQSAVYDCAVVEAYQGQGLGRLIMEHIMARLPDGNIILYASPGKEGYYKKHGFRRMKTGMALFRDSERMRNRGFTE